MIGTSWGRLHICCQEFQKFWIGALACIPNALGKRWMLQKWPRDISPEIRLELITHLLERQGNWLIMFPLGRSVTGIAFLRSVVSQPAAGITNTNLTPWHGTLILSVRGSRSQAGHGNLHACDGSARHYVRCLWSSCSALTENVQAKLQPAAIRATWDIPKATILDESSHSGD